MRIIVLILAAVVTFLSASEIVGGAAGYEEAKKESVAYTEEQHYNLALNRMNQEIVELKEQQRFMIIGLVSALGVAALFLILFSLRKSGGVNPGPGDIITGAGLVMVIIGTILIVLIADTDQQLSSSVGILGAIAGYLFGRTQKESPGTKAEEKVLGKE